ncbi:MAG: hypothetical protein AVDCRST_MAG26-2897, partial [uncultured Chloroflexia bacterium]
GSSIVALVSLQAGFLFLARVAQRQSGPPRRGRVTSRRCFAGLRHRRAAGGTHAFAGAASAAYGCRHVLALPVRSVTPARPVDACGRARRPIPEAIRGCPALSYRRSTAL